MREFILLREGYFRGQDEKKFLETEADKRARLITYTLIKRHLKNQNMSIYEFYPLPGDPTEEDIKRIKEQEKVKAKDHWKEVFKFYQEQGYNLQNSVIQA